MLVSVFGNQRTESLHAESLLLELESAEEVDSPSG